MKKKLSVGIVLLYHEHLKKQELGHIIKKDDIINLQILLGITGSVSEFLDSYHHQT